MASGMLFHDIVMLFSVDVAQVATTSADKQGGGKVAQVTVDVLFVQPTAAIAVTSKLTFVPADKSVKV